MKKIGVIVGRFQVPVLHAGHCHLIDTVGRLCDRVLVVLGCTDTVSTRNPFSRDTRETMLRNSYPQILITHIEDRHSDKQWSRKLDTIIADLFPEDTITLYGSRKSFLSAYTGRFPTVFLPPIDAPSGTDVRKEYFMRMKKQRLV